MTRPPLYALLAMGAFYAPHTNAQTPTEEDTAVTRAIDKHIDCADDYMAQALRLRWPDTAGDIADAAISSCQPAALEMERAIRTSEILQLTSEDARLSVAEHVETVRGTMVRHILEYRNHQPKKQ